MMFSVGDKVVHPGYGPGVITEIDRRQVIGEAKEYYVIDMLAGGTTLMTPVAQADNVGLRSAVSDEQIEQLLQLLTEAPAVLPDDFRERQADVEERLKEGDIYVSAEVARDLTWFGQGRGLTKRDTQLLQRAEELVGGELALVRGLDLKEAIGQLQAIMAGAIREREEA